MVCKARVVRNLRTQGYYVLSVVANAQEPDAKS